MFNPIPIKREGKIIGYSIGGDVYPIKELPLCDTVIDCSIPKKSGRYQQKERRLAIKNVIFNDPATIVFWNDDTKTVVKAQNGEAFDPEKGLALAICKKTIGKNTGRYYETFKKWLPNANKDSLEEPTSIDLVSMFLGAFMTPPEEDNENEKGN